MYTDDILDIYIARWVDLKDIILSKRNQTQQSTYLFQFHKFPEQEIEARLVFASDEGRRILTGKRSEVST